MFYMKKIFFYMIFITWLHVLAAPDTWELDQLDTGFYTAHFNVSFSEQYRELCLLPQAPVLHTYNPAALHIIAAIKLDTASHRKQHIPFPFAQALDAAAVTDDCIDIFYVAQNFLRGTAFNVDGDPPYLIRPQGWTFPNCPKEGTATYSTAVDVALLNASDTADFEDKGTSTPQGIYIATTITSHPSENSVSRMISSGNTHRVSGINNGTQTLWSLVHDSTTKRVAITLHHLLDYSEATRVGRDMLIQPPSSREAFLTMLNTQEPDVKALFGDTQKMPASYQKAMDKIAPIQAFFKP